MSLEEFIRASAYQDKHGDLILDVDDLVELMRGKAVCDVEDLHKMVGVFGIDENVLVSLYGNEIYQTYRGAAQRIADITNKALQQSTPATQSSEESKV